MNIKVEKLEHFMMLREKTINEVLTKTEICRTTFWNIRRTGTATFPQIAALAYVLEISPEELIDSEDTSCRQYTET